MCIDIFCRYVLDGDREELRNIRNELSSLRMATSIQPATRANKLHNKVPHGTSTLHNLMKEKNDILASGLYDENDCLVAELEHRILETRGQETESSVADW